MIKIGNTIVDEADIQDVGLKVMFSCEWATPKYLQGWVNRMARKCLARSCDCVAVCRIDFYMKYSQ